MEPCFSETARREFLTEVHRTVDLQELEQCFLIRVDDFLETWKLKLCLMPLTELSLTLDEINAATQMGATKTLFSFVQIKRELFFSELTKKFDHFHLR